MGVNGRCPRTSFERTDCPCVGCLCRRVCALIGDEHEQDFQFGDASQREGKGLAGADQPPTNRRHTQRRLGSEGKSPSDVVRPAACLVLPCEFAQEAGG